MFENAIAANDLTKVYDSRPVVDSINFKIKPGETFGLLGPNGAGKSTTMRMIACRTPLTSGDLTVHGYDVRRDQRQIRSTIGVVPQENNLDPDLTVLENLLVYSRYFRIPSNEAADRSAKLLDFVGMGPRAGSRIDSLSGGMKRRLMIARALLHQPKLLVLDEPTTGLDPQVRQEIWQRLEALRRDGGVTIVLSTHYMEEAEKLCERLIVMDKGRILASGSPSELIQQSVSRYALEVRDCDSADLMEHQPEISAVARNGAHFYYASDPDLLTPVLRRYEGHKLSIRPSNLEDVFLHLVQPEQDEAR
jgi:lipooligosaccharide transport system ATP-binding protein